MTVLFKGFKKVCLVLLAAFYMGENNFQAQATAALPSRNSPVPKNVSSDSTVESKVSELVHEFREEINKRKGNVAVFKIETTGSIKDSIAHMHSMGVAIYYKEDSTGHYLIAPSDSAAHSEAHIVQVVQTISKMLGVGLKILWIYSERAPCEACWGTMEKLLPNGSSLYNGRTAVIPIYSTYAWSSKMSKDGKNAVAKAIKKEHS